MIVFILLVLLAGLFGVIALLSKELWLMRAERDRQEQEINAMNEKFILAHKLTLTRREVTVRLQKRIVELERLRVRENHIHEEELSAAHMCLEMVLEENPSNLKYFSADIGLRDGIVWKKTTIHKLDRQGAYIHDQRRPHLRGGDLSGVSSGSSYRSSRWPECQHLGAEDGGG